MAQTGADPMAGLRGTYDNRAGSVQIFRERGGPRRLIGARLQALGWQICDALSAPRGSIVMRGGRLRGPVLCVRWGRGMVSPGAEGLVMRDVEGVAWRRP